MGYLRLYIAFTAYRDNTIRMLSILRMTSIVGVLRYMLLRLLRSKYLSCPRFCIIDINKQRKKRICVHVAFRYDITRTYVACLFCWFIAPPPYGIT